MHVRKEVAEGAAVAVAAVAAARGSCTLTIDSRFVHGAMPLTLVTPAGGGAHRPLLVFLHGVVYDNNSQLTDQMFAALHALGPRAPDIAFPYGDAVLLGQQRRRRMGLLRARRGDPEGADGSAMPIRAGWRSAASRWAAMAPTR